ncbi:hypothetical protein [Gluconobacter albidus]|uniref:Cuticle protein n=1 Tax=Gluconobacter albidus TaxID=318683 RepID=A0AAW3R048_9PROT|nr:hypothetical protein [Gluconobacter albidus]AQS91418.1 hypothetical protein A0U94_10950 [Gluconobacter albidus]KXV40016.1 hypothetical protein AD941_04695 [Gluconobacter albidus]GBQ84837.1 hypothetical protein AA3250_0629 [Gluconobacter albidus NBRC 3250]GLQ68832.1 hypothetical protein GCM10007866_12830 [Gluconobacter albidus]
MRRLIVPVLAVLAVSGAALGTAVAQDADDGPKKPSMHDLYHNSSLPKSHADFSRYRYRPAGDKVIEQPDAFRLLFQTKDGQPDGYAERRGTSVFYYDRYGKLRQIQPLPEDEPAD